MSRTSFSSESPSRIPYRPRLFRQADSASPSSALRAADALGTRAVRFGDVFVFVLLAQVPGELWFLVARRQWFNLPKGVAPTVPVIVAGLPTGSNERRENLCDRRPHGRMFGGDTLGRSSRVRSNSVDDKYRGWGSSWRLRLEESSSWEKNMTPGLGELHVVLSPPLLLSQQSVKT